MGFEWVPQKNYKRHFICLKCQKGFKKPSEEEMLHSKSIDFLNVMNEYYASGSKQDIVNYINVSHQEIKVVCPNCQNRMLQVHYNFEVPAQRDHKSWKKIQKKMHSKTVIPYDTYIEWHHLELKKINLDPTEVKKLGQNLTKLQKALTSQGFF